MKSLCLKFLLVIGALCSYNAYGSLQFIQNKGQWNKKILYRAELSQGYLLIGHNELAYVLYNNSQLAAIHDTHPDSAVINGHSIIISFDGAGNNSSIVTEQASEAYFNFFRGNDPSRWVSGLHAYGKLTIRDLYPGIHFELFEDQGTLKYNFLVQPYADPSLISMTYKGAGSLSIDNGELHVGTSLTELIELKPLVYQDKGSERTIIGSSYVLDGNTLRFSLKTRHSRSKLLVIDPVLVFSTYSGSTRDNFGFTATYDKLGNAYSGGAVYDLGTEYPVTPGAFQTNYMSGVDEGNGRSLARDCSISKYSADGKTLIYATYLGGSHNDQPHSLVTNSNNELIVLGTTKSGDFPIALGSNGYDVFQNGNADIFVIRFSNDGKQMLAGTYMGGNSSDGGLYGDHFGPPFSSHSALMHNYADDFRGEVIVDNADNVYVASCTNSSSFPAKNSFGTYAGATDACIFKLSPDMTQLLWSSIIGGSGDDAAYGLALGINDNLYVAGGTASSSMSATFNGLHTTRPGGTTDGFLLNLNSITGALKNATYIGTGAYDQSYMVQTDKYGMPFIYGQTTGSFPVTGDVYSNTGGKQFIAKLSADLKDILISTVFGSGRPTTDISPTSFLVDECERIFVAGWGGEVNSVNEGYGGGNTRNMPLSDNALQKSTDGSDFYLAVLSKNMEELLYGTYFGGGSTAEHVDGGTSRFDKKGIIYQSVCSDCNSAHSFPTTSAARFPTNPSPRCSNALFKIDFENFNRKPIVRDTLLFITATDTLNFSYTGSDKDRYDSLGISFSGPVFGGGSIPAPYCQMISQVKTKTPENRITSTFRWITGCQHVGDTIRIKVRIDDHGCPTADSNFATIKIFVKPPPVNPVPDVICLNFNSDGSVKLKWDGVAQNKYANYIILYRKDPNGSIKVMDTVWNGSAGTYTDKTVFSPQTNNYCYYFISRNICNTPYDNGYRVCSNVEFSTPIDSTYMVTATVVNNQDIFIRWLKSKEPDFGSYIVYRSDNNSKPSWKPVATINNINDTFWTDTKVKVQTHSYCYRLIVADQCGHISKNSNKACNIVLTGEAKPYYFDVYWTPYTQWAGGVTAYELYRRVDTGSLRPIVVTDGNNYYHKDEKLDYWWGGYFFRVKAYEGVNSKGEGYGAYSESNDLYLFQPPLLHVPNAFSPNNDGSNDVWGFVPVFVKDFNMQVYNRWGQKVFETNFKGEQWEGKTLGNLADNDVFIWIATYKGWDNRTYHQKGTVTVMP